MNLTRIFVDIESQNENLLYFNYNYELMKVLYQALTLQDKKQAMELHNEGYKIDKKSFKLINNMLIFKNSIFTKEGIQIKKGENIKIQLSGAEEIINDIVKGLIKMNNVNIENCHFKMLGLSKDKNVKFKRIMLYKVTTTIIESKWNNGKTEYLNIYDNRFYEALVQNLKRKYKLIYNEDFKDKIYFDIENILTAKKKDICNIKDNGYVKGYGNFNIWIETNIKMQKVAYYCGLGQNNSLGAGALMHLTSR